MSLIALLQGGSVFGNEPGATPRDSDDVIRGAYHKLLEHGHCKDYMARDADGHQVNLFDPNAVTFCLLGALGAACGEGGSFDLNEVVVKRLGFKDLTELTKWNNAPERTPEEVIERLERTLKPAEREPVLA